MIKSPNTQADRKTDRNAFLSTYPLNKAKQPDFICEKEKKIAILPEQESTAFRPEKLNEFCFIEWAGAAIY